MLKRLLLLGLLGWAGQVFAATVTAATAPAPMVGPTITPAIVQMVQQALHKLSAKVEVDSIQPAQLPGFYQVIASGQMVYISTDGKYMMHGDVVDLTRRENLSDNAWAKFRKAALAKVPVSQRIVFAPPDPKYTITVFTDVNCGFCRALHEHIAAFNKAGIAVQYLAWPREGVTTTSGNLTPTYTEMVSVWCAKDPKAALTAATKGHAPPAATCANPVKDQFNLGVKLGVSGTPTIYGPDGNTLGGYVTAEQLLQSLQAGG
ncbi:MAG: DsbC family protein [Rhodanobacter sp.]|nr:MAG: DsbC family protein [Rhodanobacter sp.]TAM41147.1 MAG: DsbC family protein [Rhodanobacter sp.]TAN28704.1 MAG: DsbC family protein [Rhodanobacter sp.]